MIGYRVLGVAAAAILVGSLGALAGCSQDEAKADAPLTAKQVQAASVTLTVHDAAGANVGTGSGILIAPRVVLTSAHLVAGKARWSITSADGKTKVNGIRGLTYDWMDYDIGAAGTGKAHPRKHDVAVIYLDRPINLEAYPKVSAEKLANGAAGNRLRSNGAAFQAIPATFTKVKTFPHAYLTDMPKSEQVEAGNAVLNDRNEIVGLVTGRGLTTGKLYVARTNDLTSWLAPKATCGGASKLSTYAPPPPKPGCDEPGNGSSGTTSGNGSSGTTSGNGSSGTTSGNGSSGTTSGNGSSGTTSGQSSSGDTDNPSCSDGGGNCNGDCTGVPPGGSSSGSNGSQSSSGSSGETASGGTSSGGTSSGGTSGETASGGTSSGTSGSNTGTSSGSTSGNTGTSSGSTSGNGSSGTSGENGSSGTSGSNGSSGTSGSNTGTTSGNGSSGTTSGASGQSSSGNTDTTGASSGSSGSSGGEEDKEVCEGPTDNPESCPPELDGCTGGDCGGAFTPDSNIDYGGCASCGSSSDDDVLKVN